MSDIPKNLPPVVGVNTPLPVERSDGLPPVEERGDGDDQSWRRFRAQAPQVSAAFFETPTFTSLPDKAQLPVKALLALRPDRFQQVADVLNHPEFTDLSDDEKIALFPTGKPEDLDHAATLLDHPAWPQLSGPKPDLLALAPEVQRSILDQSDHFYSSDTDEALMRMIRSAWFLEMSPPDQLRSTKLIALLASRLEEATFENEAVSEKQIVQNTLGALLPPRALLSLRFEDLPMENGVGMTGYPEFPSTIVLNRNAIAANGRPADDPEGPSVEEWMALATLPHEASHLLNPVEAEPTFEAFMDEYNAWYVGFVSAYQRSPNKEEALEWIETLMTEPRYAYIQAAVTTPGEGDRIDDFLLAFARDPETLAQDAPPPQFLS